MDTNEGINACYACHLFNNNVTTCIEQNASPLVNVVPIPGLTQKKEVLGTGLSRDIPYLALGNEVGHNRSVSKLGRQVNTAAALPVNEGGVGPIL